MSITKKVLNNLIETRVDSSKNLRKIIDEKYNGDASILEVGIVENDTIIAFMKEVLMDFADE